MAVWNGHHALSPTEAADMLLDMGVVVVPLPRGSKRILRKGWEQETHSAGDFVDQNVGVLMGARSQNLVDVDLDSLEAVAAAPWFLPPTAMRWGHASKPTSHWLYRASNAPMARNIPFTNPVVGNGRKSMIVELRVHGQTVGPGSIHEGTGETIDPEPDWGNPANVPYETLEAAAGRIASVALLSLSWVEGVRHEASLPLAGLLCRGGMSLEDAQQFMRALCSVAQEDSNGLANRLASVESTYQRAAHGDTFTAAPTLEEFIDPKIITRLRNWLHLDRSAYGATGGVGPDGWPLDGEGNVERFIQKWHGQVLFCESEGVWYIYHGNVWGVDRSNEMYQRAMAVVRDFRAQVQQGNQAHVRHLSSMASAKGIRDMLELSKGWLSVLPEELDANPFLLNVANGTLELDVDHGSVYFREARAEDLCTMRTNARYDPDARNSRFDQYLSMFFPEPDRLQLLQHMAGNMLTGLPKRHAFQLIGPTNAGKSMTLSLFGHMMGSYAGILRYESLRANPHGGGDVPRPDLVGVARKRYVAISEVPEDIRFDTATFKALVGGTDRIRVRDLYQRSGGRDVQFALSLWMSGNKPYGPPPGDEAAYERLVTLLCAHQVPVGQRDHVQQLRTEQETADAALAFALTGFQLLYREHKGNIPIPEEARQAKRDLRDAKDIWSEIIDQLFVQTQDSQDGVVKSESWKWAQYLFEQTGNTIRNSNKARDSFYESMERRFGPAMHSKVRFNNVQYWSGVRWVKPSPMGVKLANVE